MKRICNLILMNCVLWSCAGVTVLSADETPKAVNAPAVSNVAIIYWQAFARMPNLTDEQRKAINEASASDLAPLPADLAEIVVYYTGALHELRRAQVVAPCDWQLDSEQGPLTVLAHVDKASFLSRAALLRARQQFAAGDIDGAVIDVLSVYKMGRDCSASPGVILTLLNGRYEHMASEVLAANLSKLTKEQLNQLEMAIQKLPKASDLATAFHEEGRCYTKWLKAMVDFEAANLEDPRAGRKLIMAINVNTGAEMDIDLNLNPADADGQRALESLESLSVADVRESINRLEADYAELAKIAEMPVGSRAETAQRFFDSLSEVGKFKTHEDALRYFSVALLSVSKTALSYAEQWDIRRQMFEQAIHIQRDGGDVKPINGRKVEYKKTETGFELKCPSNGDQIVIKVGR
jgi:tetratricopeptide (TPR) repeat protein